MGMPYSPGELSPEERKKLDEQSQAEWERKQLEDEIARSVYTPSLGAIDYYDGPRWKANIYAGLVLVAVICVIAVLQWLIFGGGILTILQFLLKLLHQI